METIFNAPAFIIANAIMRAYFSEVESTKKTPIISDELNRRFIRFSSWTTKDHPGCAGLVLYSREPQTGKTTMLRALYLACSDLRQFRNYEPGFITAIGLSLAAQHEGRKSIMEGESSPAKIPLLFLDGLGYETPRVHYHGTNADGERVTESIEPVVEVLRYRYEHGLPTIITTDLSRGGIRGRYGQSVSKCLNDYKYTSLSNKLQKTI